MPKDISPAELGPFLGQYAALMGFEDINDVKQWYDDRKDQGYQGEQFSFPSNESEFVEKLHKLYNGEFRDSVFPLKQLQHLLDAFNDPAIKTDMPGLMAEWLEADISKEPAISLSLSGDFKKPSSTADPSGVRCKYKNASHRLNGFECAFVTVHLDKNETDTKSIEALRKLSRDEVDGSDDTVVGDSPGGIVPPHTHRHVHPGDEFIFIQSGTVQAMLDNSGMCTELGSGDYIHFNSEIPHSLWNLSPDEPAKALIVRFFQLKRQGTRVQQRITLDNIFHKMQELRQAFIEDAATSLDQESRSRALGSELLVLWDGIKAWVRDRTREPRDRLRGSHSYLRVLDHVGLSSFLANFFTQTYPEHEVPNLTKLAEKPELFQAEKLLRQQFQKRALVEESGKVEDLQTRTAFDKQLEKYVSQFGSTLCERFKEFFTGVALDQKDREDRNDLGTLAEYIHIPRILLDGYLAPPVLRAVVVRGANCSDAQCGFEYIHCDNSGGKEASHARYWIPSRTLVNSDISITLLELEKVNDARGETAWNHHPGFEMVIPLRGSVVVEYKGQELFNKNLSDCGEGKILIYRSSWRHRVRLAPGSDEARVLVMRFNVIDPMAVECFARFLKEDHSSTTQQAERPDPEAKPEVEQPTAQDSSKDKQAELDDTASPSIPPSNDPLVLENYEVRYQEKVCSFRTQRKNEALACWSTLEFLYQKWQETPNQETPNQETPNQETPNQETPNQETPFSEIRTSATIQNNAIQKRIDTANKELKKTFSGKVRIERNGTKTAYFTVES